MSALELYARQARNSKGLHHAERMHTLRQYINITPEPKIIEAILHMTDLALLRTLWEAGLRADQQEAVLRRSRELVERRSGTKT